MSAVIRVGGLVLIVLAALVLATADGPTLAALGCSFLVGLGGVGFALCVGAGLITPAARREVDGDNAPWSEWSYYYHEKLNHPSDLGDRN